MIYGNYRVISVNGAGQTLRALAEDMTTGERVYVTLTTNGVK